MEEIGSLGIPLRSLWSTLHCRRVAGVSLLLSIGWWYLSSVSPKRHCYRVSAADKGCRVYPLDPDAVALYSGCTPGKCRAWFLPDDRHTASLVGLRGGWRDARTDLYYALMDPMLLCPGKGLVLSNHNIDQIATYCRFLILSIPNNEMTRKSPFAIQKTIQGIGRDPKSTDKNITKIKCPPLTLLQPSSLPKPNISPSVPSVSASSAEADQLTSTPPIAAIIAVSTSESYTQQRPFHIQYIRFSIQLRC
ncbi:uncharacterized protein TNCV_90301 [Trichonephila clavipes]|nr:uncharacterized protein TNCV_90301 [Trichonephila clavipes]